MVNDLEDRLLSLTREFQKARIPHAIGGAIALAFYSEPRATADLDFNIFLYPDQNETVLDIMTGIFPIAERESVAQAISESGQVRIKWDYTPVDLFFSNTPFHDSCERRIRWVEFFSERIPILSPEDLAIFKISYNRPKDWLDVGFMFASCGDQLDKGYIREWIYDMFEPTDKRVSRLEALLAREVG